MNDNPFNIAFGKIPENALPRQNTIDQIAKVFESENPESNSYIITGPRGSGKTVLLTQINNEFSKKDTWIVVDLNPCMEMHEQLAARLYESGKIKKLFLKSEFSFSFKGLSFSIKGDEQVSDIYTLLTKMFLYLKKKNFNLLISVDDISKNEYVKAFAHSFQSFIRSGYPLFFVATGIYNNVSSLSNDKALTFLLRAPKVVVEPLSLRAIALSYKNIFQISLDKAVELSKITKGYAYAYQLLGNLLYSNQTSEVNEKLINELDLILEDRSYSKIWSELTEKEKSIIYVLCENEGILNSELCKKISITPNALEVYKKSLHYAGVINTSQRGKLEIALPRFKEFVLFKTLL